MGWEPGRWTGHLFEGTVKYQLVRGPQTVSVSGLLSCCAGAGIKDSFRSPIFPKGGLCFQRLGSTELGGYVCCPDLLTTPAGFPCSPVEPACFVPPVLAEGGREVRCWERVTVDQGWEEAPVGQLVEDAYCPALAHLLSTKPQLKAAAVRDPRFMTLGCIFKQTFPARGPVFQ